MKKTKTQKGELFGHATQITRAQNLSLSTAPPCTTKPVLGLSHRPLKGWEWCFHLPMSTATVPPSSLQNIETQFQRQLTERDIRKKEAKCYGLNHSKLNSLQLRVPNQQRAKNKFPSFQLNENKCTITDSANDIYGSWWYLWKLWAEMRKGRKMAGPLTGLYHSPGGRDDGNEE